MAEKLTADSAGGFQEDPKGPEPDSKQRDAATGRRRASPPPAGDNSNKAGKGATDGSDETLPRAVRIQQAMQKAQELDDVIASAQAARTEWKNKVVKGGLGLKVADFNAARRVVTLDGDARDVYLQTFREVYEATTAGGQLDWLKVAEQLPQ